MTQRIRTISLWQPWASLVVAGVKRIETRHWTTGYRGPLLIHASAKRVPLWLFPFRALLALRVDNRGQLPYGAIIGVADLVGVRPVTDVPISELRAEEWCGNFETGRFAWDLADARPFKKPLFSKGRQGFWHTELDLDEWATQRALVAATEPPQPPP